MKLRPRRTLELLPSVSYATDAMGDGYQPFPLEALPAALGTFVREGAELTTPSPDWSSWAWGNGSMPIKKRHLMTRMQLWPESRANLVDS